MSIIHASQVFLNVLMKKFDPASISSLNKTMRFVDISIDVLLLIAIIYAAYYSLSPAY